MKEGGFMGVDMVRFDELLYGEEFLYCGCRCVKV